MDFNDLIKIIDGYRESSILHSAVELGIFESLADEYLDREALAKRCNCDTSSIEILLNALVSMNLLNKSDSLFSNTDTVNKYFIRSSASYMGDIISFTGRSWNSWSNLTDTVRTGDPQEISYTEKQYGDEWEYFIRGMHNFALARGDARITADVIDLSNKSKILDVACGPGTYAYELCERYPKLKAVLFDLPETLKIAKNISSGYDLDGRLKFIEGNYKIEEFPRNIDCTLLFNIIHQETSEDNRVLISKIFDCLSPDGMLVIKDHILNEDKTQPLDGSIFSVQMQLTTGGRCYSEIEVKELMSAAGFVDISTIGPVSPLTSAFIIGIKKL